jgi:hypothetical protein
MAASVIAAAAMRAEREIVAHLRSRRATSPETATELPPLSPLAERRLRRLVDARAVREAPNGYWLDEVVYASHLADRRSVALLLLVALFGVLLAVLLARAFQRA